METPLCRVSHLARTRRPILTAYYVYHLPYSTCIFVDLQQQSHTFLEETVARPASRNTAYLLHFVYDVVGNWDAQRLRCPPIVHYTWGCESNTDSRRLCSTDSGTRYIESFQFILRLSYDPFCSWCFLRRPSLAWYCGVCQTSIGRHFIPKRWKKENKEPLGTSPP